MFSYHAAIGKLIKTICGVSGDIMYNDNSFNIYWSAVLVQYADLKKNLQLISDLPKIIKYLIRYESSVSGECGWHVVCKQSYYAHRTSERPCHASDLRETHRRVEKDQHTHDDEFLFAFSFNIHRNYNNVQGEGVYKLIEHTLFFTRIRLPLGEVAWEPSGTSEKLKHA